MHASLRDAIDEANNKPEFIVGPDGNQNTALHNWLQAVIAINNKRLLKRKGTHDDYEEFARAHKYQVLAESSHNMNNTLNSRDSDYNPQMPINKLPLNSQRPSSFSGTRCPQLTNVERRLLHENGGCTKCRRFWMDHWSSSCPHNFPDGCTYRNLTAVDVPARPPNYIPFAPDRSSLTIKLSVMSNLITKTHRPVTAVIEEIDMSNEVAAVLPTAV